MAATFTFWHRVAEYYVATYVHVVPGGRILFQLLHVIGLLDKEVTKEN